MVTGHEFLADVLCGYELRRNSPSGSRLGSSKWRESYASFAHVKILH